MRVEGAAGADTLRLATADAVRPLRPLFNAMYGHFEALAGRPLLRENGFDAWLGLYDKVADRSRMVIAAQANGTAVGFAEGLIRAPAAHAPPGLLGFVAHLYVQPEQRGSGLAKRLVADLLDWFAQKGTIAVDLQVVHGNDAAMRFWRAQGFAEDLCQMRLSR